MNPEQGGERPIEQVVADNERRRRTTAEELLLSRTRAASWAKGVGAVLVVGLAFSLVKGRSDISALAPAWAIAVGAVLAFTVVLSAVTAYYLFQAAYGPLKSVPPATTDRELSDTTMRNLRKGLVSACVAVAALMVGVAISWYGPAARGPFLEVSEDSGGTWCGKPVHIDNGVLALESNGQKVTIDLDEVARLRPVTSCPPPR
ncbi:hypothetical protein [Glycomyces harbinensis]|uniref:Uncharacterized protein n=1 Tax=Glycomyces harbinensis TaxID=58114 RepID=A0A1G6XS01_9ACTN|nr:hypothetical protein [Glycomyces harbinensis]SDD80215.1 hypothetical protein SAMN05216270_107284 [Glycomyces harbinensis]